MQVTLESDNTKQLTVNDSSTSTRSSGTNPIHSDDVKVGSASLVNEEAVEVAVPDVDDEKTEDLSDIEQHEETATGMKEEETSVTEFEVGGVVDSVDSVQHESESDDVSDEKNVVETDLFLIETENDNDTEQHLVLSEEVEGYADDVVEDEVQQYGEEDEEGEEGGGKEEDTVTDDSNGSKEQEEVFEDDQDERTVAEEQQQQFLLQQQHEEQQQQQGVEEDTVSDDSNGSKKQGEVIEDDRDEQTVAQEEEEEEEEEVVEHSSDKSEQEEAQQAKGKEYTAARDEEQLAAEQAAAILEQEFLAKAASVKSEQEATDAAIAVAEQEAEQQETDKRAQQEADDAAAAAASAAIEAAASEEAANIERAANDRATSGGGGKNSMSPSSRALTSPVGGNSPGLHRAESHGEDELLMIRALVSAEENRDAEQLSESYSRLLGTSKSAGYENGSSDTDNDDVDNGDDVDGSKLNVNTKESLRQHRRKPASAAASDGRHSNAISAASPTRTVQSIGSAVVANILATLRDTRLDGEDDADESPPAAPEGLTEEGSVDLALIGSPYERYLLEELLKQVVMDNDTIIFAAAVGSLDFRWWCLACLRARRYRLQRSVDLLRSYAKWRRTADVMVGKKGETAMQNQLASGFFFTLEKARCVSGKGVVVVRMNAHEPRLFNDKQVAKAFHHVLYTALRNESSLQLLGFNFLIDMSGVSMRRFDRKAPEAIFRMINSRFPIRYGKLYVHNAPTSFSIMYRLASLFMTRKMKDRIVRVYPKTVDKLIEVVGEKALPVEFGGANEVDVVGWARRVGGDAESETEDCEEEEEEEEEEESV